MLRILFSRWKQKHRTMRWPAGPAPAMPDRFRGRPAIDATKCVDECRACLDACPTDALAPPAPGEAPVLDLGKCLFCTDCVTACPEGAFAFTKDFRLATDHREDLMMDANVLRLAQGLTEKTRKLFGRSLKLRVVSAGGCNGCESDVNVLNTIGFDLARFGIQFVASPRHADGLLVTGALSENMRLAVMKTWDAIPSPKIVIAVGACAISGGPFAGHQPEVHDGITGMLPVDLFVPGCPPHPMTILDGLLRLLGRIEKDGTRTREA